MSTTNLKTLAEVLAARGLVAEQTRVALRAINPKVAGCCGAHPSMVITIRDNVDGASWFYTNWGEALAPVTRPDDAARAVRSWLSRTPNRTSDAVLA